jgi:hypothetical protein
MKIQLLRLLLREKSVMKSAIKPVQVGGIFEEE